MGRPKYVRVDKIFAPWERGLILEAFVFAKGNRLEEGAILENTHLPAPLASYHLDFFVEIGLLEKQVAGGRTIYRMQIEKERVRLLKELVELWYKRSG